MKFFQRLILYIFWSERLPDEPIDQCSCSVDGTDCSINQTSPYSSTWYSRKISAAAVRYESAASIREAGIVSVRRPLPSVSYSDLAIFRYGIRKGLQNDEFVVTDRRYPDTHCIQPPGEHHPHHRVYLKIRSRHEVLNKCVKQFGVMTDRFRHSVSYHCTCFHALLRYS